MRVALIRMPYVGERNTRELSGGPEYLEQGGIHALLEKRGCRTQATVTAALSSDEQQAYGAWNRMALANGNLSKRVAEARRADRDNGCRVCTRLDPAALAEQIRSGRVVEVLLEQRRGPCRRERGRDQAERQPEDVPGDPAPNVSSGSG